MRNGMTRLVISWLAILVFANDAIGQVPGGPVKISFMWNDDDPPKQIVLPNDGESFVRTGTQASATLTRPVVGERRYVVEILYVDGTSYPLELRMLPVSRPATIMLSRKRPASCSNNNLSPLEAATTETASSIRAAFSVQYLLSRETEANSCAPWPLRAKKARHDRYCNMMTSSEVLVVPRVVRTQFREEARGNPAFLRAIDNCEREEALRRTIVMQMAAVNSGNALDAYTASAVLRQEANADAADVVYSQISQKALDKQTDDLRWKAAEAYGDAAVSAIDESIASEMADGPSGR